MHATSSSARDAVRCLDHRDRLGRHDPEDLLGHHDPDHQGRRIHDQHLDHRGAAPCRDDRHPDHRGDQHLGSSGATDRPCRRGRDRARSAECDRYVRRCHRDAGHQDHDPSVGADHHLGDGTHPAAAELDDHCQVAAESDDHSGQDAALVHPAAGAVLAAVALVAVPAHLVSKVRRAPIRP